MNFAAAILLGVALVGGDDDPAARAERAFELGAGGAEAVPELVELLRDADPVVRGAAVASLRRIGAGARAAAEPLRDLLDDRSVRCAAAKALAVIAPEDPGVATAIVPLLADASDVTREEATRALTAMGGTAVGPLLRLRADGDASKLARDAAARALVRLGRDGVPELRRALGAADRVLRWAAILTAADLEGAAAPAKEELLAIATGDDAFNAVWARAALVLVTGEAESHVPAIRAALGDERVWRVAIQAIVRLGPKAAAAIPELLAMLDEEDDRDRRWQAAVALGELGPAGQPALPALLRHDGNPPEPDPYVRTAIRTAIEKLRTPR